MLGFQVVKSAHGKWSAESRWWVFSGTYGMCIVLLCVSDRGNRFYDTFVSELSVLIAQQKLFFPPFCKLPPLNATLPRISCPSLLTSSQLWPLQEPGCDLAVAVNLEGGPQPLTLSLMHHEQRLRASPCGWESGLINLSTPKPALKPPWLSAKNTPWSVISNVWALNAPLCSIKIRMYRNDRSAFSLSWKC